MNVRHRFFISIFNLGLDVNSMLLNSLAARVNGRYVAMDIRFAVL
jgi:hypothetical protein